LDRAGRGCLFAALAGISAALSLALIVGGPCEGPSTGQAVGLFVFVPLVVIFSSTPIAIGTWREDDRLRRRVGKIVGSVAVGMVAGAVTFSLAALAALNQCFD